MVLSRAGSGIPDNGDPRFSPIHRRINNRIFQNYLKEISRHVVLILTDFATYCGMHADLRMDS